MGWCEHDPSERLRQEGSKLQGIYAKPPDGAPERGVAAGGAMKTISVSVVAVDGQTHALLSLLTEVQKRLLELWDMPPDLCENVRRGFSRTRENASEP
jgi:hypothetical protein